jgi:RNA polymerase sigma-70 factor, ECF subfamily
MINQSNPNERQSKEDTVIDLFLDGPNQESFAALFNVFSRQLVAFFRSRRLEHAVAEDLAQEVMFTVYCKAGQLRDRLSFRVWLFKIARSALCRHYGRLNREVDTVNLADVDNRLAAATHPPAGTPTFEFRDWMALLDARERDDMMLRFVEQWEYHEIAAVRGTPIGTVQSRIFYSKKKLAKYLASARSEQSGCRKAPIFRSRSNAYGTKEASRS